ncbi:hypothetical protein JQC72_07825 [Polycladomyces sp. WAk]|uniref:PhiEco32-like amidoligase-type 2 protein n=1 Tax=Polycladomyces zharkentensis TaxID=2807616 RepID=A0ABS2WIQ5_9BACL|nr:hypothetical protein [Polycladomyces sp. WAk]MBN2909433.1 hypothetical protein [Polycladomyces sp. WAk]
MSSLTLPCKQWDDKQWIRSEAISAERVLSPSIRLELSNAPAEFSESMLVLNDEVVVERIRKREIKAGALKLHGISFATAQMRLLRQYIVVAFQTETLLVYRSKGSSVWLAQGKKPQRVAYERVPLKEKNREVNRVQQLAVRSLYALGLDYGVVKVGTLPGRKFVVVDVIPNPRLNTDMENVLVHAIYRYAKQLGETAVKPESVTLGADPEFIMKHANGQLALASQYFPRFGRVGCDEIWHGQNRANKPLVEIRPQPTPEPRKLVVRIYQGLIMAAKRVKAGNVVWLAGGMPCSGYPLGGHIHFSGILLNFKLLRALDNYLALPLVLAEDPNGVKRRPKYGYLGDFRHQFHGGFEYRTLPSWLISPTVTKGVIAAAQLIASRYPYLELEPLKRLSVQRAYYQGIKTDIQPLVETLWEDLRGLNEYQGYAEFLDPFYEYLLSGQTWDEQKDIRKVWKVPPYQPSPRKTAQ